VWLLRLDYLCHLTAFYGALHNPNTKLKRLRFCLVIYGAWNPEHLGASSIPVQNELVNEMNGARLDLPSWEDPNITTPRYVVQWGGDFNGHIEVCAVVILKGGIISEGRSCISSILIVGWVPVIEREDDDGLMLMSYGWGGGRSRRSCNDGRGIIWSRCGIFTAQRSCETGNRPCDIVKTKLVIINQRNQADPPSVTFGLVPACNAADIAVLSSRQRPCKMPMRPSSRMDTIVSVWLEGDGLWDMLTRLYIEWRRMRKVNDTLLTGTGIYAASALVIWSSRTHCKSMDIDQRRCGIDLWNDLDMKSRLTKLMRINSDSDSPSLTPWSRSWSDCGSFTLPLSTPWS
jgi:hypothetical protein